MPLPTPSPALRREAAATARLAGPIIGGQLAHTGLSFIDTVMAGKLSAADLAAVAIGGSFWSATGLFFLGVLMALPPSVAQLVVSQLVISRWKVSRLKPAPSLKASLKANSPSRRPPFCQTSRCTGWMRSAFQVQKLRSFRSALGVTLITPSPVASRSTVMPELRRELKRYVLVERNQLL